MSDLTYASPLSILVVDDEPLILEFLADMLREHGHTVGTAGSGEEALQLVHQQSWNLVLTDRAMSGMSGEILARHVKEFCPGTAVLMMTGFLPQAGCTDVDGTLCKPFTLAALATAISAALAACPASTPCPTASRV